MWSKLLEYLLEQNSIHMLKLFKTKISAHQVAMKAENLIHFNKYSLI